MYARYAGKRSEVGVASGSDSKDHRLQAVVVIIPARQTIDHTDGLFPPTETDSFPDG